MNLSCVIFLVFKFLYILLYQNVINVKGGVCVCVYTMEYALAYFSFRLMKLHHL